MRDDAEVPPGVAGDASARADRAARNAALTLALALPADTVLYLLLPLHAAAFGVSLPEVGVLLAANRLVRIAGNGWVARFYALRGPKSACLLAAFAAACTAFGYAMLSGIWPLLAMRLLWGLSFSALNIANHALPTSEAMGAARRAGRARAIVAAGPMVGLMGGALLAEVYGPRVVFAVLGAAALIAPLFARRLPSHPEAYRAEPAKFSWPTPISTWSFSMGFVLDGLFIFGLSLLAKATVPQGAAVAAGAAMALRYLAEILLSPAGGAMAQRHGARRLLIALSLACSAALLLLGTGGIVLWIGVIATVMLRALIQPLPAPVVAEAYPGPGRVPALARQATWRDIGAGAGPLAAGLLFPIAPAAAIYVGAAILLAASSLLLLKRIREAMPTIVLLTVLGAALLHAGWNALAKGRSGSDPLAATMMLAIGCGVASLPVLAVAGLPGCESTLYVLASVLVHIAYFFLVGLSYRYADYSAVYPLMRGSAPLITTLLGAVVLAEPLTPMLLGGVVLLSLGVLGLGADALRKGGLTGRGLLVAAANICVIVGYTLLDGVGVRLSGNAAGYVSAILALTAVFLLPLAIWLNPSTFAADIRANWRIGLIGGTMAMTSYGIALWAMTKAPIGAVAALRETSVLFGTLIAAVLLKERFGPERWIAAAAICVGLGLIRLA